MILAGAALFAAVSVLVMVLWNILVSPIFGLIKIGFWQAAGFLVLSKILFGCHHHGRGCMHHKHAYGFHHHHHNFIHHNFIHRKWMKMSDEERKAFVEKRHKKMHDCCGGGDFSKRDFYFDKSNDSRESDDNKS